MFVNTLKPEHTDNRETDHKTVMKESPWLYLQLFDLIWSIYCSVCLHLLIHVLMLLEMFLLRRFVLWFRVHLHLRFIFTTRKRSLGQGNVFTGVCQSFCSQGEGVSVWGVDPPGQRPPYGKERAVRILLECILVRHKLMRELFSQCNHKKWAHNVSLNFSVVAKVDQIASVNAFLSTVQPII